MPGFGQYTRFGLPNLRSWNLRFSLNFGMGAKTIALVQMIVHIFSVLTVGVIFAEFHLVKDSTNHFLGWSRQLDIPHFRVLLGYLASLWASYICLHVYLYYGIFQKDIKKVDRYWKIMLWMTLVTIIYAVATKDYKFGFDIGLTDLDFFLDITSLAVIYAYRRELEKGSVEEERENQAETFSFDSISM